MCLVGHHQLFVTISAYFLRLGRRNVGPGSSGELLTDTQGNCLKPYHLTRNTPVYPLFDTRVLSYEKQEDGTYMVSAGPNIANVSRGCIPEYYKTVRVTAISENVFANVNTMEKLEIPATIQRIGVGVLPVYASSKRKEIVVYENTIQQNYEIFYFVSYEDSSTRLKMSTSTSRIPCLKMWSCPRAVKLVVAVIVVAVCR